MTFKTFKQFVSLQEALVTFGGKAYPKYGNVVIMAGGSASGKGFVTSNLLGIEGKVMDVDAIKSIISSTKEIRTRIEKESGVDISSLNFKNPEDVAKSHHITKDIAKRYHDMILKAFGTSDKERLPNIIFDVTLDDFEKLNRISGDLSDLGYDKQNIHIVWVVNSKQVAIKQNSSRKRTVPEEILIKTHSGAARTMSAIYNNLAKYSKQVDGDIWFVFNNKEENDSKIKKSEFGGQYIDSANYSRIKKAGSSNLVKLKQEFIDKIYSYTEIEL